MSEGPASVPRWKVTAGRTVAAVSVLAAVYGVGTFAAAGRFEYITEEFGANLVVGALGLGVVTWLAMSYHSHNRAVWVLASAALLNGLGVAAWATGILVSQLDGLDTSLPGFNALSPSEAPTATAVLGLFVYLSYASFFLVLTLGLLLFPDGRLLSPRWRWVGWAATVLMVVLFPVLAWQWRPGSTLPYGAATDALTGVGRLVMPMILLLLVVSGICLASLVVGYRRSRGLSRQQYRWIGWGTGALLLSIVVSIVRESVVGPDEAFDRVVFLVGMTVLIASYGVAITRYRLYDIDIVISKTFVFGVLAAFIGLMYVVMVVGVGRLVGAGVGNLGLAIAATAVVAVVFEPVRQRAQRWANRLVYGRRATPYEVVADLTRRLAGAESAEGVLGRMVRLLAEGTGADSAVVWLVEGSGLVAGAGWPRVPDPAAVGSAVELEGVVCPVSHDGEPVGALQVVKARGNPVTPPEQRLIADLAGSAGLVLGNQRLNAALAARAKELQASRRRLVEVQDAERRRLERDLHDGAQQQLVALKVQLGVAEALAQRRGADAVAAMLHELGVEAQQAVEDIRVLAKGLYPPLLETEGLEAALRSQAASTPVPVAMTVEGLGRYPKEVEAAVYFAVLEALTNAVRHATPSRVAVRLAGSASGLHVEVADDGVGFYLDRHRPGSGLTDIRDRIEALGGTLTISSSPGDGTTVSATVPLSDGMGSAKELTTRKEGAPIGASSGGWDGGFQPHSDEA